MTHVNDSNYFCLPGIRISQSFKKYSRFDHEKIIEEVCKSFEISRTELVTKRRFMHLVTARKICCYLIKKYTTMNLPAIAKLLGCDHTTVIYSIRTITDMIRIEDHTRKQVTIIETNLLNRI